MATNSNQKLSHKNAAQTRCVVFFLFWCVVQSFASAFADSLGFLLSKKKTRKLHLSYRLVVSLLLSSLCYSLRPVSTVLKAAHLLDQMLSGCIAVVDSRLSNKVHIFCCYRKWTAWVKATKKLFFLSNSVSLFYDLSFSCGCWETHFLDELFISDSMIQWFKTKNFV